MRTDDLNLTDIIKDSGQSKSGEDALLNGIELDAGIPAEVSLERIRRKVLSEIRPQRAQKYFKRAVMIPAILLILLGTISVYAYTNNLWDMFFSNFPISESIGEKTFPEKIVTSNGYKITLHNAAFDKNNGLVLLSLERTDNGVLDRNTLLNVDIPLSGYGSSGSSSERILSQDGKTMYYCYLFNNSRDLTSEKLALIINSIDTNLTSIITSDVSLKELYSDKYSDILPLKENSTNGSYPMDSSAASKLNARLETDNSLKSIDNAKGSQLVTAGFTDEMLCVVYKLKAKNSGSYYIWLSGLTDSRTGEYSVVNGSHGSFDFFDETGTFEYALFTNYKMEDLEFLFPTFTLIEETGRIEGDWSFEIESFSELQTIYASDGLNASAIDGIQIEKLTISPIGIYLLISGESAKVYDETILNHSVSNSYLLMEDGARITLKMRSGGSSQSAGGAFISNLNLTANKDSGADTMIQTMLTDTEKVKAVYFLGTLIWERP